LFLLLFLILPIAALVMLFIASRKTKRNPDKWKGPIWVTLLTIALAIWVYAMIVVVLFVLPY